jgi:hypothetical protein
LLPRSAFDRKLKSLTSSLGSTENVHPQRLRHTYATELLRHGVSLPGLMKLLGHRTLKMTLRYVEVTNEDLGREYLRAIERARHHYANLKQLGGVSTDDPHPPIDATGAAFDHLLARIQALRFDHPDPARRHRLQRFVERLRRAQRELPDLLG